MKKQLFVLSLLAGFCVASVQAERSAQLVVNGDVSATTCDITLDRTTVNLHSVVSDYNTTAGTAALGTSTPIVITTDNCRGSADPHPSINVSGTTGNTAAGVLTFNDSGSATDSVGIVVASSEDLAVANRFANDAAAITPASAASEANFSDGEAHTVYVGMAQQTASQPAVGDSVTSTLTFTYTNN